MLRRTIRLNCVPDDASVCRVSAIRAFGSTAAEPCVCGCSGVKYRPQGSLLRRCCLCSSQGSRFCAVHRLKPVLAKCKRAQPLWSFDIGAALKRLRRLLTLSHTPSAPNFTFKAFRAGKATALAAAGKSVGTILQAGEWRSAAFLNYVDTDVVDQARLLDQAMDQPDEE